MPNRKAKQDTAKATLARVKKEMARPRVAKSARAPIRAGAVHEPHLGRKEVV
jgi:hypothetical protein